MKPNLSKQIEELRQKIKTTDISFEVVNIENWSGADVIIKEKLDEVTNRWLEGQPSVISFQSTEPRRRAVITKYPKELSWLFYQLKNIFFEKIDYVSKYDFYGLLAQSAIDYILENESDQDLSELLLSVFATAKIYIKNSY